MPHSGDIRDINSGRRIGKTSDLTRTFTAEYCRLVKQETEFFVLHGACRHLEMRLMLDLFQVLNPDVPVVFERWVPPEVVLLVEGRPDE